jgi:RNA polymerase sigma-70 factor (ECF subfamily)
MNIEQVIKRAKAGDTEAISDLYQLHADAIYRYILYRVPTDSDAEDLTAEVFLKMVEGLSDYQYKGIPFEAWLYRIAAARVADFHRSKYRHPETELQETLADHVAQPEEQVQQLQEIEGLRQILDQFSEEEQTLLILRFVERKSHKEVANILGKTPAAVKAAQHRVLVQLASLLGTEEKARHYLRGQHD